MKTRGIILLIIITLITLSFTFKSINRSNEQNIDLKTPIKAREKEPIGGFTSQDKL